MRLHAVPDGCVLDVLTTSHEPTDAAASARALLSMRRLTVRAVWTEGLAPGELRVRVIKMLSRRGEKEYVFQTPDGAAGALLWRKRIAAALDAPASALLVQGIARGVADAQALALCAARRRGNPRPWTPSPGGLGDAVARRSR